MTVNMVHLSTAVDEFRNMASTWQYRSVSSSLARKTGLKVLTRDQMGAFWSQMREALRVVDPLSYVEADDEDNPKKRQRDSGESAGAGVPDAKRSRVMGLTPLVRSNAVRKVRAQTPAPVVAASAPKGKDVERARSPPVADSSVTGSIMGTIELEEGEIGS
jgi:hypothetical protein